MVNNGFTDPGPVVGGPIVSGQAGAERRMILFYAPSASRDGMAAVLALDDTLGSILRTTRDPMVGQMRLTWWHDALSRLDDHAAPAEPVLEALARHVLPLVTGKRLAAMIEGWEELLDPAPLDTERLMRFASRRGGGLFAAIGTVVEASPTDPLEAAGQGWALADLAGHVSEQQARADALALALPLLRSATRMRWSRRARGLGAMAHLAVSSDAAPMIRMGRLLRHRLTGC